MARYPIPFILSAFAAMVMTGCDRCADPVCDTPDCNPAATPFELDIPPFFPPMDIPQDNPLTEEGIALGRLLFWEKELSADGSMSCGSCHLPEAGFADPNPYSTGITGAQGVRNAMALRKAKSENLKLKKELTRNKTRKNIIGQSPRMRSVYKMVDKIAYVEIGQ